MEFVVGMASCDLCGDPLVPLDPGGAGAIWTVHAECPRCARVRLFVFYSEVDLVEVEPAELELGGPEPSQLIEPFGFMTEIDRLSPRVVVRPERLDEPAWSANLETTNRIRTALLELAKFIAEAGDAIPTTAHHTPAGRADQAARPERYTRAWLDDRRAYWDEIVDRIEGDAPRLLSLDPMLERATPPRGTIDLAAVRAHAAWVARGRTGDGRLDVVTRDAHALHLPGAQLAACRLEGVLLGDSDLRAACLDDAALLDVDLTNALLDGASFAGARLAGCSFAGALVHATRFQGARLERCSFDDARLDRAELTDAAFTGVTLQRAALTDARLDGARFVGCDLRGASLASTVAATARGATFERCDLRDVDLLGRDLGGASFVRCAFRGAHGLPAATDGISIVDPDFSRAGDGSLIGSIDSVLDRLAE